MKIVVVSDWFSEKMGYAENALPKALASLGHDVHLITSDGQPYFNQAMYAETYAPFIGPAIVPAETKPFDGYTLHRLPHSITLGRIRLSGFGRLLSRLKPDIVQTFDVPSFATYQSAVLCKPVGFKLFVELHLHASAFKQTHGWQISLARALGRGVSAVSETCYVIGEDVGQIAVSHLGISPSLVKFSSLGVDTQLFRPATTDERASARRRFGFRDDELVCVYTGRFSSDKAPLDLAKAVESLARAGQPFRGLFVGGGSKADVAAIQACTGCVVAPFVPSRDLPPYYWAGDIGVWPKQESTSQLDAAASALPIVVSDKVHVRERVDGNGLYFREGDVADLAQVLTTLVSPERRRELGEVGAKKMSAKFSWLEVARERVRDYEAVLGR